MDLINNITCSEKLPEVKIVNFNSFSDQRGSIWTSYSDIFSNELIPNEVVFKHDKFNSNRKNVLRGIHGDDKTWKLVSCPYGEIEQVVVDLRPNSSTYKKWIKFQLSETNRKAILIPPMFGNAFCVLSDGALYHYKLAYEGDYNDQDKQFTFAWDDETIAIDWQIANPIISSRDMLEGQ